MTSIIGTPIPIRRIILVSALVVGLFASGVSPAHVGLTPTTLTATRDADGNVTKGMGTDQAATAGEWTATVLAVTGKIGQAWLIIKVDTDSPPDGETDTVNIIGGHPKKPGSTLRSNQVIPAGPATLTLTIFGGHGEASVMVQVNHP